MVESGAYNPPVVTDVLNLAVPFTSNVFEGAVLDIPILPFVVNKFPRVFALDVAFNEPPVTSKLLTVIFVSIKLTVDIFVTTSAPFTYKLLDKCILAPEYSEIIALFDVIFIPYILPDDKTLV